MPIKTQMRQFNAFGALKQHHNRYKNYGSLNAAAFVQQTSIHTSRTASTNTGAITTKIRPSTCSFPSTKSIESNKRIFSTTSSSIFQTPLAKTAKSGDTIHQSTQQRHTLSSTSTTNVITDELNPSQREATLRPRYSITRVIAGPGAGKTRVLTCRIAHLLLDTTCPHQTNENDDSEDKKRGSYSSSNGGTREEGILAVTFTKKAALEMERRLVDLLSLAIKEQQQRQENVEDASLRSLDSNAPSAISTGEYDDEYTMEQQGEIVRYGNAPPIDTNDNVNEESSSSDRISKQYMKQITVGTFHSVCSKILRRFGKELGDLPSVRSCLGITNASGAIITQVGIQSEHNDEITTKNNDMLIETLDGSFNILDQADQLRLLKEVLQKHNIELKSPSSSSGGSRNNNDIRPITVLNAISLLNTRDATQGTSSLSRRGSDEEEDDDIASKMSRKVYKIAMEVQLPFQKAKYTQNSVDFDDLILLTRELLLHHPEVREILHRRWRHVLVDEFQDTSRVQLDLVRLLTTNSLFVVGDGDQSIYSWRGASPESMSDFEIAFHNREHGWEGLLTTKSAQNNNNENLAQYLTSITGREEEEDVDISSSLLQVKSVYLMENYRSTTNIVKAAQRIISTSEKSDKNNNDDGSSSSTQENIRRDMKPMRGHGPSPRVLACKDAKAEAKFVVNTINSMIDSGELSPSSTVAMIYRTNAQSRLLEEACVEHNLRYVVRGSSGTFYKRAEIQDCMSFLKIMYNARDRSAWARAVKAPSRGIGEGSLNEFFRYCDAVTEVASSRDEMPSPLDVMISLASFNDGGIMPLVPPKDILSTRSMNRFIPFASSLRSLRRKAEVLSVSDFLLSLIDDIGLKSHFDSISKTRDEYEDRLGNVMELVRAAERYREDGPCISQVSEDDPLESPLGNFLDDVALIADLSPEDESESEGGGRVVANLMTIHSAKGLEFDAVFLVGNEEGTFPTQRSIAEGEGSIELSEERRLCYVAMTRAKTHLVLTWRREVSFFAGAAFKTRDGNRSRFLDALVSKQGSKQGTGGRQNPRQTVKGNNISSRKSSMKPPSNNDLGSMTKRQLHSEANRYLAGNKSWDSWEPSSSTKLIGKTPTIKQNFHTRGLDRRQVVPSSQTQTKTILRNNNDRRQVPSSLQNQNRPRPTSRQPARATNQRQTPSSIRSTNHNRTGRTMSSPGGDAPPDCMDSTLFFPVGSSVKHKLHGKGTVLTPPKADAEFVEKMLVRVQFLDDMEWDLPMTGLCMDFSL